jgi:hypothetical protein
MCDEAVKNIGNEILEIGSQTRQQKYLKLYKELIIQKSKKFLVENHGHCHGSSNADEEEPVEVIIRNKRFLTGD